MNTLFGLDYPTWWFLVVGAVFSAYVILDGFDLGAGALHLFFKDEESRRIALNAIGPVWDGNEVWLVVGGGAFFAGFPVVYATLLSAMYIPFMLFLLCIILRAVSIEFRSKEPWDWWKNLWDTSYCISSGMLSFLLGIILGNILLGMPINDQLEFSGDWLMFLNPYAITVGLTSLALMSMHGAIYLAIKTEGKLYAKVVKLQKYAMIAFMVLFGLVTVYSLINYPHLTDKLKANPIMFIIPVLAILSIANIPRLINKKKDFLSAFIFSSLTFIFLLILVAIELYPTLLLSTENAANSITIYHAASSDKSLGIMLIIAAIGAPLTAVYTYIVYRSFWGKVKLDETSY